MKLVFPACSALSAEVRKKPLQLCKHLFIRKNIARRADAPVRIPLNPFPLGEVVVLRSGNKVVLQIPGQLGEVGAVPRDAHDQPAVFVRFALRLDQRLTVDHIELHMPQAQVAPRADQVHKFAGAFRAGQTAGRELDVQQARRALVQAVVFGLVVGEQDGRRTVDVRPVRG